VLLDWSRAGRLSAPLRHALIALCLYCVTGDEPSPEVPTRLGTIPKFVRMQKRCWRVSEIRAMFYAEAQESPGALTKKRSKEKA
jgi:hypothetical protein